MKKHLLSLFFIGSTVSFLAQQNVSISDVPATPNPTSVLDVSSTTKGMLMPRLTTVQRNSIVGPANGLLVYDTDVNCVMYYSTTLASWNSLCSGSNASSLIANTTTVASGANCPSGGVLLQLGNDSNSNGILDVAEITTSQYICNGQAGATGPQGPIGLTGAAGATGPQGPIGLTGPAGATGPQGLIGLTGPAGPTGPQGPIGLTGPAGATGPQGPIGLTGSVGANGINCWDTNGNGTNDPSEDTNGDGLFNSTDCTVGIAGPQGPAGPTGPQGLIGLTGPAGTTGAQGPIGLTGPAGPAGPQGPIGLTGPAGTTGAQGPIGLTGPAGPTGPQGPIGLTGPAGSTGAQGPIGLTGPAGTSWTLVTPTVNPTGTLTVNGTAGSGGPVTTLGQYWIAAPNTAGTNALTATGFLGTSTNQHMDLVSNNLVRGRLSNLGEFFIGTTTTALAGDLMNGVSNATFPWAINGYSSFNGSGVYGRIMSGNTNFGGVQGEYFGTSGTGAGVRGIAGAGNNLGVNGQNITVTTGWSGLFQNDLGYTGFFGVASDRKLKQNIQTISNAISIISRLRGTVYEHNFSLYPDLGLKKGLNYGFIAQEVEDVLPDLVREKNIPHMNSCYRGTTYVKEAELVKTVSYIEIVPLLVEGMKEQQKMIAELKAEIELLKLEIKKD